MLKAVLAKDGRTISPDPTPEKGSFYRSDHISLAKKGVPMLDLKSGTDLVKAARKPGRHTRRTTQQPLPPGLRRIQSRLGLVGRCRRRKGDG